VVDSASVLILQPYVPQYRVAFFEALAEELDRRGISCLVAAGKPHDVQARRADAKKMRGTVSVRDWSLRLGRRSVRLKLPPIRLLRSSSLVICELASGSVETSVMLTLAPGRTAVWGHARSYVSDSSTLDGLLERWQMRRSTRTFAYTAGGGDFASESGVKPERITVVQNSLDTNALRREMAETTIDAVEATRAHLNLSSPNNTACFIGALDRSKRLDKLLAIADNVVAQLPDFRLLVAGAGPLEAQFTEAIGVRPHVLFLGRADLSLKAMLAKLSRLMIMPGRVGLVAVDSFAMQVPIITTAWRFHAPEFEYLVDGVNALIVPVDSVEAMADSAIMVMRDDQLHKRLREGCLRSAERYSLQAMVLRFADGVALALNEPKSIRRGSHRWSRVTRN
jgi:glycosyltransferase involved in cell wall biosynthesis